MEQKILSLKDDKINSEVELYEYPVELRGGRNYYHSLLSVYADRCQMFKKDPEAPRGFKIDATVVTTNKARCRVYKVINSNGVWTVKFKAKADRNTYIIIDIADSYGYPAENGLRVDLTSSYVEFELNFNIRNYTAAVYNFIDFLSIDKGVVWIDDLMVIKGNKTPYSYTPAPEDLNLSYPDFITEFKPSISDRYILTEELFEYPVELIGGRNLLTDEKRQAIYKENGTLGTLTINHSQCPHGFYMVNDISHSQYFRIDDLFKTSGVYTLSFEFRGTQGTSAYTRVFIGDSQSPIFRGNAQNDWLKFSFTATIEDLDNKNYIKFYPAWIYAYFRNIKLEKGSKATDWTPAPEDLGLTYPDHIQSFGTSFSNNILINEFIEQ